MIHVVIAKPTRSCNADCTYCSSPPLQNNPEWDIEKFNLIFNKLEPYLLHGASWIWHGGEPMLMGTDFYEQCSIIGKKKVNFSMQTNLLGYHSKWKSVFENIFEGRISSSIDPFIGSQRTIKGDPRKYQDVFLRRLEMVVKDGFRPLLISTFNDFNIHQMDAMYEWNKKNYNLPLRFNYCFPSGCVSGKELLMNPQDYGNALKEVFQKWIKEALFPITPFDQLIEGMFQKDIRDHSKSMICPWTDVCGGKFLDIEPDGNVFNCSEFADIQKHCFGNIFEKNVPELFGSEGMLHVKKRPFRLPQTCLECEFKNVCHGGCQRDAEYFNTHHFPYCQSWKMILNEIKTEFKKGKLNEVLKKLNIKKTILIQKD